MDETIAAAGNALRGKTIIDCTNPIEVEHLTLTTPPGESLAEHIERATGGHVVKAFNLCQASVWRLDPPVFDGRPLPVPFRGDDETALGRTEELITALGCVPVRVGDLRHARHVEAMAAITISLLFSGRDPHTVFNLVDLGRRT